MQKMHFTKGCLISGDASALIKLSQRQSVDDDICIKQLVSTKTFKAKVVFEILDVQWRPILIAKKVETTTKSRKKSVSKSIQNSDKKI